jgi:hypothetical protein
MPAGAALFFEQPGDGGECRFSAFLPCRKRDSETVHEEVHLQMKAFGQRNRFGIECEIDRSIDDPHHGRKFGRICVWAKGHRIGNWDSVVLLPIAADYLGSKAVSWPDRFRRSHATKLPEELLQQVEHAVFDEPDAQSGLDEDDEFWERILIFPGGGASFDGELAILIATQKEERFIWRVFDNEELMECSLSHDEFNVVVRTFLEWCATELKYA